LRVQLRKPEADYYRNYKKPIIGVTPGRTIMPTRKASKKPARKAIKATSKGKSLDLKAVKAGRIVLYGPPIRDAIKRGDLAEMKKIAELARSHVKDVETALSALENQLSK
jgi:hypothetical protein